MSGSSRSLLTAVVTTMAFGCHATAQEVSHLTLQEPTLNLVPTIGRLKESESDLRATIERYTDDLGSFERSAPPSSSSPRDVATVAFLNGWLQELNALDFDQLNRSGQVDFILFRNELEHSIQEIQRDRMEREESAFLFPFGDAIVLLEQSRRVLAPQDWQEVAGKLAELHQQVEDSRRTLAEKLESAPSSFDQRVANRAFSTASDLQRTLERWFRFYDGYDPLFSWWNRTPFERLKESFRSYRNELQTLVNQRYNTTTEAGTDPSNGREDGSDIVGLPIGRDALISELRFEMIPYSPEELIAIAEREYDWCEARMLEASASLGFGDNWKAALEAVKQRYVDPGEQPKLIQDLALEAIDYIEDNELITLPSLCKSSWRMAMMSPERQLVNPFFTGGETITVSYPTDSMSHEAKLMSLRGNNRHFSRATVHHELIPGHHLQGFMTARYATHRRLFATPFWLEGWALYWELLLWDRGFATSPEDQIGMLFWRMHRCARIIFSLNFHLGQLTPQECIALLIDRVGHEPANAIAEVRRSVATNYGPLYQAAYLLGGLQFRALRQELVESGRMTDRAFHDAILRENQIPVAMVRALLDPEIPLTPETQPDWRFYDQLLDSEAE